MKSKNKLILFLIWILISYSVWFVVYEFLLKPNGKFDHLITEQVTIGIVNLMKLTGYDAYYTIAVKPGETYVFITSQVFPVVRVGASCNGLELLVLFALFVACYPGKWKIKIPFIVGGLLVIHGANIFRNYCLTLMSINKYAYYDLFHRYIFIFFVYGIIFAFWMLWTNHYSKVVPRKHATQ